MKWIATLMLSVLLLSGCATPRNRFLVGMGAGAAAGAIGGSVFSPNDESRGMNAVVFGLSGALVGGVVGILLKDDSEIPDAKPTLKMQELGATTSSESFNVDEAKGFHSLPQFVRDRLQPALIESYEERASISDDGVLREPHRVWRIKYPTQLMAQPQKSESKVDEK